MQKEFSKINSFYIADGHHRAKSAFEIALVRREENKNYANYANYIWDMEFNFFMGVLIPDDEIKIIDYNRVIFNVKDKENLLEKISENFEISKVGNEPYSPKKKHDFGMYFENLWYKISAKENLYKNKNLLKKLDVSILYDHIIKPIFEIENLRTDKNIDFIGGTRGLKYLEKLVKENDGIAFSLFPVTIKDIEEIADNNEIMPPKSTWFIPKLLSGLFLHRL